VLPAAPLLPSLPKPQHAHLLTEFRADPLAYHGGLRARVLEGALREFTDFMYEKWSVCRALEVHSGRLLVFFRPPASAASSQTHMCAEYIRATRRVQPQLGNITVPWICFHGEGWSPVVTVSMIVCVAMHGSALPSLALMQMTPVAICSRHSVRPCWT
jgi:hypothetical protein